MKISFVKSMFLSVLCLCAALVASGCTPAQESYKLSENHKIIFDTDTAADDAMALMMAAKAPNIEIVGVTVLAGNVSLEQACKNALMSLEVAGYDGVPVYLGSATSFEGEEIVPISVFGDDGMGDQNLIHPKGAPSEQDGIDFIIETVKTNPGKVEIVATGPLTNVAKAIQKDPETMKNVKRIWAMGTGGVEYMGNVTPIAEFNVAQDPEACKCVLESGIPMTIVGNDVCGLQGVRLNKTALEDIGKAGACGEFASKAMELYVTNYANDEGYVHFCDPVAVAAVIWDDFVTESKLCYAMVVTEDSLTRGMVIFYEKGVNYDFLDEGVEESYCIDVVTGLKDAPYLNSVCQLLK